MAYTWQLINASANVPSADGVGHCTSTSGYRHLQGGILTSLLSSLYIATPNDPTNFQFIGNLPIDGSHTHPLVPLEGRVYKIGGDAIGGHVQDQIYSWNEDGSGTNAGLQLDLDNVPGLDGAGHFAFELNGWIHWGGGQRLAAQGGAVGPILTLYRWKPGQSVEQVFARAPYGVRGWFSTISKHNGKIILPGGAIYEDGGLPRFHQNDFVTIDADYKVETISPRTDKAARIWQNSVPFDNKWFLMLGHNGTTGAPGDMNDVHISADGAETLLAGPTFPGTARHAAAVFTSSAGIDVVTGSHYGTDLYRLFKDAFSYGAPHNSATGWGAGLMTSVDRFDAIPAGTMVASIGWLLSGAYPGIKPKIVRENSTSNYDVVWNGSSASHPGGGYHDFSVNFTLPNDGGVYRKAFSHSLPNTPAEPFSSSGSRSYVLGDATGNGVAMTVLGDGTICTRWAES